MINLLYPEYVQALVDAHWADQEIADLFGMDAHTVYRFRKYHSIPAGRKGGAQPGHLSRNWKGGRIVDKNGYVLIHTPTHPQANCSGYVREHRLVMEAHLGRTLGPKEVVHHKDGNKQNNAVENLHLYAKNADHLKEELAGRCPKWTPEGRANIKGRPKGFVQTRVLSAEARQKMSAANKGKIVSAETRAKLSEAQKQRFQKVGISDETRQKLSATSKGRSHTPEWRKMMSEKLKGRVITPEWKAKVSATKRANHAQKQNRLQQVQKVSDTPSASGTCDPQQPE